MTLPTLSEQIRMAIKQSGTSRYVLAHQAGISEAALSRFLTGKSGLTLATLDRLGSALGLQVITTVQKTPRPSPKGRKPKGTASMTTVKPNKAELQRLALAMAEDANENHFPSRRGVWELTDRGLLCVYNNNPYQPGVVPTRDDETARFRAALKAQGLKEVGYAEYPPEGEEDAGYTYALLIEAGPEWVGWVADTMAKIVSEAFTLRSKTLTRGDATPEFLAFSGEPPATPEVGHKPTPKSRRK
jgi:transcriptional regulator with XRE-family HTH domain